jgi:uncharacterized protein (DUF433 family)
MDWSGCELVEVIPGKVSGVPLVKGTRIPADFIVGDFESGNPIGNYKRSLRRVSPDPILIFDEERSYLSVPTPASSG